MSTLASNAALSCTHSRAKARHREKDSSDSRGAASAQDRSSYAALCPLVMENGNPSEGPKQQKMEKNGGRVREETLWVDRVER